MLTPEAPDNDKSIQLTLSASEALVLFELLSRWEEDDPQQRSITLEYQAEQRVLWDIQAMLERTLAEPFRSNYRDLLRQARREVQDDEQSLSALRQER